MAETFQNGVWTWKAIAGDLAKQGGFDGVIVDPSEVKNQSYIGKTKNGTWFTVTWIKNSLILISMTQAEQPLIDAFSKAVEYQPFCRYAKNDGMITFEWDKVNPEGRFLELQREGKVTELQRI